MLTSQDHCYNCYNKQNGAIIASVISETVVTLITLYFARKRLLIKLEVSIVIKTIISSILMVIAVIFIKLNCDNNLCVIIISLGLGGFIYLGSSFILRNPVLTELIKYVKRK